MYIENNMREQARTGSIEVICGSMFSGKTEELIRRVKRAQIARQKITIFKPTIDIRYSHEDVVSHNQNAITAIPVEHSRLILHMGQESDVVAVDEAQFFDDGIVEVCNKLANMGKRVIVAGLDMDYLGQPFGPMPNLLAIADEVYKTRAICMQCGRLATFSYRIADSKQQVLLGEKQEYMPLCRSCYQELQK
ncbi:MAG: thymidine kinase [Bacteroidales bacterium]|nr:thymidine kinase [Bacteroidales bacterium]